MKSGLPIDVRKLLAQEGVESLRVEYKAEWNHVCGSAALRTVCAFANDLVNAGGGYVVLGVDEQDGRPVLPPRGLPPDALDQLQKEVQGAIKRITPSYAPMIVPEQVDGVWVLVIFCPGGDARPYEAPESLAKNAERRAYVRTNSQTREARGEQLRQLHEVAARTPFDDRACYEASVEDLDPALLQHHLQKAGSRLAAERDELAERARRLHLLKRVNGHEAPRNVALLFFSEDPRRWFRGAAIEIAHLPRGRGGEEITTSTVEGPLPTQIRTALDHLRGLIPAEIRKRGDRAESDRVEAWPFAAVEEALVNAVHHRGYDDPQPTRVTILPDALEIVSYPGPMPGLSLADVQEGRSRPIPARNRRIAELLKAERLAEGFGTGLQRIRQEMARNGSPPPVFHFDEEARNFFEVRLPIHPAFLRREDAPRPSQPLRLGRPAPPAEVVGREALVERVLRLLDDQSVLLVGPRGRGVSSLIGAVAARLPAERVFRLDVGGVTGRGFKEALITWLERERKAGDPRISSDGEFLVEMETRSPRLVLDGLEIRTSDDEDQYVCTTEVLEEVARLLSTGNEARALIALGTPSLLKSDECQGLHPLTESVPVPPLDQDPARDLAARLLRGAGLDDRDEIAAEIAQVSGGIPELIVRIVARLKAEGSASVEAVTRALDALAARPGDPLGLRGRLTRLEALARSHTGFSSLDRAILSLLAAEPGGRRRLEVLAAVVSKGHARLAVLDAITSLELEGWICEVDGVLRFEHPWLADHWNAGRLGELKPSPPYQDDDVPF